MDAFTKTSLGTHAIPDRRTIRHSAIRLTSLIGIWLAISAVLGQVSDLEAHDDKKQLWQGVLEIGPATLTLNLQIENGNGTNESTAFVHVVEQGNAKLVINKLEITEKVIAFEIDRINASFRGSLNEVGKLCSGEFIQHGKSFDLDFKRVESFEATSGKLVEYWKGSLDHNGREMKMGLKVFQSADGSLSARLSSYSQGATDLPVVFEKDGDNYIVRFPAARLEYTGRLNESKEKLIGTIKQAGTESALTFAKAEFSEAPKFNRPQTPKEPFPYKSIDVNFENTTHSITLAGTLTVPKGAERYPAAIIISGSGPTKRDGTLYEHRPYLVIADHLTRQGIAVLRFDDRGAGESTGKHSTATSADLATDVEAGIEFLKQHPSIAADKIGLIGHSEGGLIAPMVAAKRKDLHFIVLLAGTGVNGGVILKSQSTAMMKAAGQSEEKLQVNRQAHDAILSVIHEDHDLNHDKIKIAADGYLESIEDESVRKLAEPSVDQLVSILKSKWVRYFVRHEPVPQLEKVSCHVLAMNGEKDLQVLCDLNLNPIENALRNGSPASFKVLRMPNMNHLFQETEGSGAPSDYGSIDETISPKVLKILGDWVLKVTK